MAVHTGVLGSIASAGAELTGFDLFKWSLSIDREALDVSSWSNATNARDFVGGMYGGTGSFEGFLIAATAATLPPIDTENDTGSAFTLIATTGREYTFTGIITNMSPAAEKQGLTTVSGTFTVNGAITIA